MALFTGFMLAGALAGASVGDAQERTEPVEKASVVVTNPSWKTPPAPTDTDFPLLAYHLNIDAIVRVECEISVDSVPDCKPDAASVEGLGFEQAAVAIVERGRMNPRTVNRQPVTTKIAVNLPFVSEQEPPLDAIWDGPEPTPANLLSGLVAAQSLLPSAGTRSQIDWGLHQIAPERAEVIQGWISEMYIGRTHISLLSRAIAMTLAKRGVRTMPTNNPPDWADWVRDMDRALSSLYSQDANFGPLRARYCARYGCGED